MSDPLFDPKLHIVINKPRMNHMSLMGEHAVIVEERKNGSMVLCLSGKVEYLYFDEYKIGEGLPMSRENLEN